MIKEIKIFYYIEELDAFLPTPEYLEIADYLALTEWNPVVWIGRLFYLDDDVGEHWFDNWDLREEVKEKAISLGYNSDELLIIDEKCFVNEDNQTCNADKFRKRFWTDVLRSLKLDIELLFEKARENNEFDSNRRDVSFDLGLYYRTAKIK